MDRETLKAWCESCLNESRRILSDLPTDDPQRTRVERLSSQTQHISGLLDRLSSPELTPREYDQIVKNLENITGRSRN
jgi:hypothetical protein